VEEDRDDAQDANVIFRSVLLTNGVEPDRLLRPDPVPRPPVSVPNVVDNLWEWARPERFPSRRFAVFGSPSPELAAEHGPDGGEVYAVEFLGDATICQVRGYGNSKHHPECIRLPIFLYERLGGDFLGASMEGKVDAGRLWLPCLTKEDVERVLAESSRLRDVRDELRDEVRYWDDVVLVDSSSPCDPEDELFFDAPGGYYLRGA
jgi:hypothetical protein